MSHRLLLLLSPLLILTSSCLAETSSESEVSPGGAKSAEVIMDQEAGVMEIRCTSLGRPGQKNAKPAVLRVEGAAAGHAELAELKWSPESRYLAVRAAHHTSETMHVFRCEHNRVVEVDTSAIAQARPGDLSERLAAAAPGYAQQPLARHVNGYALTWNKGSTLKVRWSGVTDEGRTFDLDMIFDPETKRCSNIELMINDKKQVLPLAKEGSSSAHPESAGTANPGSVPKSSMQPVKKSFWKRLLGM